MHETMPTQVIPPEQLKHLEEVLARWGSGKHDPEATRQAVARMDEMREKNLRLYGEQAIAVQLIRQARNGA